MTKRHLVLYGLILLVLVLVAGFFVFRKSADMSYIDESAATTTPNVIAEEPVVETAPSQKPPFKFEIVTDRALQAKGLSGRPDVPADYGMLFVFPDKDRHGFWMKDMLVPIDIIWISDTGFVVGIEASAAPETYPNVFYPPEPVRYVLETKAGEAARLGINVGTKLNLPLPYGRTVSE